MLVQPTTIAQAQAAGSPYFWDNGQKKLAITAEQLAAFKAGGQYDPAGGSALTQWANIQNQPQMDLEPRLDIPRQAPPSTPGYIDKMPERAPPPEWGYIDKMPEPRREPSDYMQAGQLREDQRRAAPPIGAYPSQQYEPTDIGWKGRYNNWFRENVQVPVSENTPRGMWEFMQENPTLNQAIGAGAKAIGRKIGGILPQAEGRQTRAADRPVREGRVAPVSYSQVAVDKIADWEGFREKPYMDAGSLRIGYGRKAKKGETTTSGEERGKLMTKVHINAPINFRQGKLVVCTDIHTSKHILPLCN